MRQRTVDYYLFSDQPPKAVNDESGIIQSLTADTPLTDTHRKIESLIEDASLHIMKLDTLLFENGDPAEMLRHAKAIASAGRRAVDTLSK